VARRSGAWERHAGTIGLVVGATAPSELAAIREVAPDRAFLVPGVGSQGGDAATALLHGPARTGAAGATAAGALLVNVSRAIASAGRAGADPGDALAESARKWSDELGVLR
jgi:orotidine-5'-phosphate decarboxylase